VREVTTSGRCGNVATFTRKAQERGDRNPLVGDLELPINSSSGQTLQVFSADPATPTAAALLLLAHDATRHA
jgi:hypothetical protein